MSADSIHNLVRGLAKPYVGAHFVAHGNEIKVWKTSVVRDTPDNIEPGKVMAEIESKPVIKCGKDAICLLLTEPHLELSEGSYL
jgi:methionyl-tRNA formyltransferase